MTEKQRIVRSAFDSLVYRSLDAITEVLSPSSSVKRGGDNPQEDQSLLEWMNVFCPPNKQLERIELLSMEEDAETGIITAIRQETWASGEQSILLRVTGLFKVEEGKISQWHDTYDQEIWDSL